MSKYKIFVSSVQKEFSKERRALKLSGTFTSAAIKSAKNG